MILRTLGVSEIVIGHEAIGTERPTVFVCLLLLALAHPRRLSRVQIAADLWPSAAPPERNHRLRTLLYRSRQLGAPLVCDENFVALSEAPVVDFREYSMPPRSVADARSKAAGLRAVLPGIDTIRLGCIADRLDDARNVIVATLTSWTSAAMLQARSAGEWHLVRQLASGARDIDRLNAAAWLSLAEAQCLTGNPERALQTLDEYVGSVGDRGDAAYASALDLRQRIVAESARSPDETLHVGHDAPLRRIWTALGRAHRGRGGALVVRGPAGIGKTRLLDEAERATCAAQWRLVRVAVQPVHALRPFAFARHLVARLIDEPGAAGCEPDAYSRLQELAEPNEPEPSLAGERLFHDITELLAAVSDESPLVVAIDDAHIADAHTWPLFRALFRWSSNRRVLWILTCRAMYEAELHGLPDQTILPRVALGALDRATASALLASIGSHDDVDRDLLFDRSGGSPLLLHAAARPFDVDLGARAEAAIDDTISRLTRDALAILGTIVLSGDVEAHDLAGQLSLSPREVRETVIELLRAGLLYETDGLIRAHAVWADALLANYAMSSPPMSAAMMAF